MLTHLRPKLYPILLVLGLLVVAPLALAQDGMDVAPPRVIDTDPLPGEELALDSPVRFIFDRPMDAASEITQVRVEPALDGSGTLNWEDNGTVLVYTPPASGYQRDTEYTFIVDAESADGLPMADPFRLTLQTVGYLEVSDVIPQDGAVEIETSSTITVIFNRPVVPLLTVEEQDVLPSPISISPAVEGEGEWLNTSIYVFRPDIGLEGGTQYTVTVETGLESLDGAILDEAYTFSFITLPPRVTSFQVVSDQGNNALLPLDPVFEARFTQPMDPSTQEGLRLEDNLGNAVPLSYEWQDNNRVLRATPADLLQLSTFYQAIVDSSVLQSQTGTALSDSTNIDFQTVPYPAIIETTASDGVQNADPYGGFQIYFNAPINEDSLEDKITVEPEPAREYETFYRSYDNSYRLLFDTQPDTTYTITIAPGISDPYGNTINEEMVVTYTTGPYNPSFNLQVPGQVGTYNAFSETTRLFATHRNVDEIDTSLYRLDIDELAAAAGTRSFEFFREFTPAPGDLIRRWTTPVEGQQNQWRYELLTIAATGPDGTANLTCVGAAESRLQTGMEAVVGDDDPSPLRLRAEPNIGGDILGNYDPGTSVNVIGGPRCADGFWWWQVYVPSADVSGWMAEGSGQDYFLDPVGEPPAAVEGQTAQALAPGAYYLEAFSPQALQFQPDPLKHVLLVTTHNITLKFSPDQAFAWVNHMQTGQPAEGVTVRFYDESFTEIAMATTDADGLARVNIPRLESLYTTIYAVVDDGQDFGFVATDFARGIDPWRLNINTNYDPDDVTSYVYTDRPIYRPDQPVYYRGVVRAVDDVTYTVIDGLQRVLVTVYDAEGQVIHDNLVDVTPYGTFSGQFDLEGEASLGYYRLVASLPEGESYREEGSVGFSVAEYRAPEFQVTLTPALSEVAQGQTLRVEVDSRYFFGAPVSNAELTYNIFGENYFFEYDGPGRWQFIDFNYDSGPSEYYTPAGEEIASGEGTTDDEGRFIIEVPTDLGDKTQSQQYTIEAVVTDESDQVVAGRTQVVVHQGLLYVGLSPEEYVVQAETESAFNVLTVDWDSQPVAEQPVDYRIVRREWSSVQEKDSQGRTVWKWEVEEIDIDSGSITTDADGRASIAFTPPQAGGYKIYAETRDADGNRVNSSAFMWVSGSTYVPWRQQNDNTIDLIADADSYSVNDEAEILIASPFQGVTHALVTVERGDVLKTEVIRMETNSHVYRLPIEANFAPNVYVSVMLVKGVDETSPFTQFRYGVVQLGVETDRLNLNVEVTPDLEEGEFAGPGDEVTLNVKTTDWQGEPVSAEVGVGVTDLAVLSIAPPNTQPLMAHFYGQQGLSVRTASPLTISTDQVTQQIIDIIKGGGGGGGELGIFEVRQDFVDTPLWSPTVVTDENGEAQVTVTLPDNLTTWRVDARGVTGQRDDGPMLVGQTTADFLSTKPLLVRPVTPRFFVVGDEGTLGVIVNNNTDNEQVVDVLMEGTGFLVQDDTPLRRTVTIPAGGRTRVDWPVSILDVNAVDVTFAAINEDETLSDASKPPVGQGDDRLLPVYRFSVKETVGTAGVIESDEAASFTEFVALPPRIVDDSQGDLRIEIDRSLAGPTLDGLDYLRNFEHQCIEQTVSRFLPNIITLRALRQLDQSNPQLEAILEEQVNFALQRLYAQQKVDGGWGWFPADESNPLTTAYALIGLSEAQRNGEAVEQGVIDRARTYLRTWLIETSGDVRVLDESQFWQLNRRAFVLYAMSRADEPNASMLAVMYDLRQRLNLDAKAFLAMALMAIDPNDSRVDTLISDFNNAAVLSATGAHWEDRPDRYNWTTNTRTTALILMAMIQHGETSSLLSNVVRWLMVARTADAWETTQETAWSVMALTDWMVVTGELEADYTFNLRLNDELLDIEDNTATDSNVKESEVLRVAVQDLLLDEANRLVISKSDGPGNLYYTAHLNAFLAVPEVEPLSQGITVSRRYYLRGDEDRTPITSAEIGQEVMVEVTIIAPRNLHYVVVEDPIPAGADAIDPNLLTTSVASERPQLDRDDPLGRGWGWWWFSRTEFRDEKVVMYATYLPRGTYTYRYSIRPGLVGDYNVIPTTAQEFYFPEVYGRGQGQLFTIEPAPEDASSAAEPAPVALETTVAWPE